MSRLNALLVEAPSRSLLPLRTALHALGIATHVARSHQEAIRLAAHRKLDGAFVDAGWLGGPTNTVAALRQSRSNARMPVTVIVDHASGREEPAFASGATNVLVRPCPGGQLWEAVRAVHVQMHAEHRRYQRVAVRVPVFCAWEGDRRHFGTSLNLSPSGMLLEVSPRPPVGAVLTLAFGLGDEHDEFMVRGTVVRADARGHLGIRYQWHSEQRAEALRETLALRVSGHT